ncbi:MAG: hypothetical protein SGPRY_001501 [Prymnesium sp.]
MRAGAEKEAIRAYCEERISRRGSTSRMVEAMIRLERSSFSIGLTLRTITVSIREVSKQWVAATS